METRFEVENRKNLVKALEELTMKKAEYQGAPSFAYKIGSLALSKDGTLSWGEDVNATAMQELLKNLAVKGFNTEAVQADPDESIECTIAMPMDTFTPEAWENLQNLLKAKGQLIQKALGLQKLPEAVEDNGRATFPWFQLAPQQPDEAAAFAQFVEALCSMAKKQKRVTAKEKPVENEKYAFRCFLLRLGFIGSEYKGVRKALLKNFTGSAAFKGGVKNVVSE